MQQSTRSSCVRRRAATVAAMVEALDQSPVEETQEQMEQPTAVYSVLLTRVQWEQLTAARWVPPTAAATAQSSVPQTIAAMIAAMIAVTRRSRCSSRPARRPATSDAAARAVETCLCRERAARDQAESERRSEVWLQHCESDCEEGREEHCPAGRVRSIQGETGEGREGEDPGVGESRGYCRPTNHPAPLHRQ